MHQIETGRANHLAIKAVAVKAASAADHPTFREATRIAQVLLTGYHQGLQARHESDEYRPCPDIDVTFQDLLVIENMEPVEVLKHCDDIEDMSYRGGFSRSEAYGLIQIARRQSILELPGYSDLA